MPHKTTPITPSVILVVCGYAGVGPSWIPATVRRVRRTSSDVGLAWWTAADVCICRKGRCRRLHADHTAFHNIKWQTSYKEVNLQYDGLFLHLLAYNMIHFIVIFICSVVLILTWCGEVAACAVLRSCVTLVRRYLSVRSCVQSCGQVLGTLRRTVCKSQLWQMLAGLFRNTANLTKITLILN